MHDKIRDYFYEEIVCMEVKLKNQASLFSAITIGVGSIVGSGWLFASYYAAKYAGPISILSWLVGAVVALVLALLLAEIATMYQETALFSRLLTITHNKDYGFLIAISNWFAMMSAIPSEAMASTQYVGHLFPRIAIVLFRNDVLTAYGIMVVCGIIMVYGVLNYWGIRLLSKANDSLTTIKMIVPAAIGIIFMFAAFHPENFHSYHNSIAPYGYGRVFSAVVDCGIFYAFYGFSLVTVFAKELKNPKRNLPLALIGSVLICLVIYLILQVSFIGAMNPQTVAAQGWHGLNFESPLADLAVLLGINWVAIVLFADAAISPSGTGVLYVGSGTRMLNGMADDQQMPKIFSKINAEFFISRTSLGFTLVLSMLLVFFFDNWQKIMIVVTVFQLMSCLAVPVAFTKLRISEPNKDRQFKLPFGKVIGVFAYLIVTYLIIQCGISAMILALAFHLVFFCIYCFVYYGVNIKKIAKAFMSSWTMFAYFIVMTFFSYLQENSLMNNINLAIFLVISITFYVLLIKQRNYSN